MAIPFGHVHDPLGPSIDRLLAHFPRAADTDTQLRYCVLAGEAIWANGQDLNRPDTFAHLLAQAGIAHLAPAQAEATQTWAEDNRQALLATGLWGVPSFAWDGFYTWGQDRLWMLDALAANA